MSPLPQLRDAPNGMTEVLDVDGVWRFVPVAAAQALRSYLAKERERADAQQQYLKNIAFKDVPPTSQVRAHDGASPFEALRSLPIAQPIAAALPQGGAPAPRRPTSPNRINIGEDDFVKVLRYNDGNYNIEVLHNGARDKHWVSGDDLLALLPIGPRKFTLQAHTGKRVHVTSPLRSWEPIFARAAEILTRWAEQDGTEMPDNWVLSLQSIAPVDANRDAHSSSGARRFR